MNRTNVMFGGSVLVAALLGLPVDEIAAALGFGVGLLLMAGHLLGLEESNRRLGPVLFWCVTTSLLWGGVAAMARSTVLSLVSTPGVWAVVIGGGAACACAAVLLLVADSLPEPAAPKPDRPTTRTRARIVEPVHDQPGPAAFRQGGDEDFDLFGERRD